MLERLKRIPYKQFWDNYSNIIMIVLLIMSFRLTGRNFQTVDSLFAPFRNNVGLFLTVAGLSYIMVGGGIDLSIGSQISLNAAVVSILSIAGFSDLFIITISLLVGMLCGMFNGILVGYAGIAPFAATIAAQIMFRGFSYALTNGSMISNIVDSIRLLTRVRFGFFRLDICIALCSYILLFLILHGTWFGKHLRAVGLDEKRALRIGIPVKRVKCVSYCIAGLFYALASMMLISRQGYAGSMIGEGSESTAIAAAYIGGGFMLSEKQNVFSLFLGVFIVAVISTGFPKVGISVYQEDMLVGLIVVISVIINRKKKEKQ